MPFRYNVGVRRLRSAVALAAFISLSAHAQEPETKPSFDTWLAGARTEALARGISEATVAKAFDGLEPLPVVVERDRIAGRDRADGRRVRPASTDAALRAHRQRACRRRARHPEEGRRPLRRASRATWSRCGAWSRTSAASAASGRSIQALATLAWEGRRGAFFTDELIECAAHRRSWRHRPRR